MDENFLEELSEDLQLDLDTDLIDDLLGDATEESVVVSDSQRFKDDKKSMSNAERCKRHRMKKRALERQVHIDNAALKYERQKLEETLSALQNEVQTLRGQGVMDLTKENKLLRAEIAKHKAYLERVVAVALETPLEVGQLETMRLMKSGVESAVAQIAGLAYSSINNPAWNRAVPMKVPVDDSLLEEFPGLENQDMEMLYQHLPFDAPTDKVVRLNSRIDIVDLPIPFDDMYEVYWQVVTNVESMTSVFQQAVGSGDFSGDFEFHEVYPNTKLSDSEEVACTAVIGHLRDSSEKKKAVFASGRQEIEMFALAFPDVESERDATKCKIIVSTNCNVGTQHAQDVEQLNAMSIEGMIIRDAGNGKSSMSWITSDPCKGGFAEMFLDNALEIGPNGELSPLHYECISLQINATLKTYVEMKQSKREAESLQT